MRPRTGSRWSQIRERLPYWPFFFALCVVGGITVGVLNDRATPESAAEQTVEAETPSGIPEEIETAGADQGPKLAIFGARDDPNSQIDARFCDPMKWRRLERVFSGVDDGEASVYPDVWDRFATRQRVLLSSWISKCTQGGGPVRIRDGESQELIASYDAATGYKPAD